MGIGLRQFMERGGRAGIWLWLMVALMLLVSERASAEEPCKGKRALDPRTARLQVLGIDLGKQGIIGRVRNTGGETALGVMVWVNYYIGRRGGFMAQQCIPVGDLRSGEERAFHAYPIGEADRAESWDYAADAVGWR